MEFVEQHRSDAVEHRIVEDEPGEDAFGDDLDAGLARHFRAEPYAQPNRLADALAQGLGHPLGGRPRRETPRFQDQDAAFLGPSFLRQYQRHFGGLTGAGRRHQHRGIARAQGAGEVRQRGIDRQRGKIHSLVQSGAIRAQHLYIGDHAHSTKIVTKGEAASCRRRQVRHGRASCCR